MDFAGWALADLGVLFGAGAAVITLLYLLRMRRRQVIVPFAALWEQVTRESETRRLWRKLRRLISWLVQLILLALICLALGDPRPEAWLREPRTTAIVIDTSASMAARGDEEGRTRLEVALERARGEIETLGPADRILIVTAGSEVEVPAPLGGESGPLLRALDENVAVGPGEADLTRALLLARNALEGRSQPRILILTDGALDEAGIAAIDRCVARSDEAQDGEAGCAVMLVGQDLIEPVGNVAITAFAARRYPLDRDKVEVLVEVQNLGSKPASFELRVSADNLPVGTKLLELAAGERRREVLPKLEAARETLVAQLAPNPEDPSSAGSLGPAIDDRAWAVVPPLDPMDVVLVTDGTNLFTEAALLILDDYVRLTTLTPEQGSADHEAIVEADIVFYDLGDNPLPKPLPNTNMVVFDPWRFADSPFAIRKLRDLRSPRLSEQIKDHELLTGVVFKDVNMVSGISFDLDPGDLALVSHLGEPMVVLREGDHALLAIGFDPRASDLPLRTAYPLLIANAVDYFGRREAGFVAAVPIGASRELALADLGIHGDDVTRLEVTPPDADPDDDEQPEPQRVRAQDGRFRLRALDPGVYRIEVMDGEATGTLVEIAVNQANTAASNLESRLDPEALGDQDVATAPPEAAPLTESPLWTLILLAAIGLIGLEWATYHRRKTV
ncbi:vWA domain-containing protein [Nannocystaceae bacterium ST9]